MKEILTAYPVLKGCDQPEPFGNGHINDTFLVKSPSGKFILQRVNRKVFDIAVLTKNLSFLFAALADYEKENKVKLMPAVLKNEKGDYHTMDSSGAAWRVVEFFPDCKTYLTAPDEEVAYQGAKAMGAFQRFMNTLPVEKLQPTIPGFHDTPARLSTFLETVKRVSGTTKKQAVPEIDFLLDNRHIAQELQQVLREKVLPVRVTHNDTKLENILFTADGQVLVIDPDTIMPGSVIYDFGDMVRTFTSPAGEDEPDLDRTTFRVNFFEALTRGYLESLKDVLSAPEKQYLLLGAKAILYEQALRFLNDFLQGNIYYKVDYPEHNLVRTRTQIKLLTEILQHEKQLRNIIAHIL